MTLRSIFQIGGLSIVASFVTVSLSYGEQTAFAVGETIIKENCTRCHAITQDEISPFLPAPSFTEITKRYPAEHLAEAFAEGISVGHEAMPEFVFPPNEIEGLITFLNSLSPSTSH